MLRFHAALLLLIFVPGLLSANMADPVGRGDIAAEPAGALSGIHIEREDLRIDLRGLKRKLPASIEATYYLRNDGQNQHLDLRFVSGSRLLLNAQGESVSLRGTFEVLVDGRRIDSLRIDSMQAPTEWLPPAQTPGISHDEKLSYTVQLRPGEDSDSYDSLPGTIIPVVAFTIDLAPGTHTLRVHYQTNASSHSEISDAINWQIAYILAPVRRWGSFRKLDVHVILPEDWLAATEPSMTRRGDTLIASWSEIPSDALAITTRMSLPFWIPIVDRVAAIVAAIMAIACARFAARSIGRSGRIPRWGLVPIAFVLVLIVVATLIFGYTIGYDWYRQLLGDQLGRGYNYLRGVGFLILMIPITAIATFVIILNAGRKMFDQRVADSDAARSGEGERVG